MQADLFSGRESGELFSQKSDSMVAENEPENATHSSPYQK